MGVCRSMNTFVTSDTHFSHTNIIKYSNRPFSNVDVMDEVMIRNWNKIVRDGDLVYHLGDFAFANNSEIKRYREQLNGEIILVEGNHDKTHRWSQATRNLFKRVSKIDSVNIGENHVVLCHYAMRVWDCSHYDSWHLFGHTHGTLTPVGKTMDVGVDCNNFIPISLDKIEEIMKDKPHNESYIEQ